MRAGSREAAYVLGGVGLGCLALVAAFVLPGVVRGSDTARTVVMPTSPPLVPQDGASSTPDVTGETTPSATVPELATPTSPAVTTRPGATRTPVTGRATTRPKATATAMPSRGGATAAATTPSGASGAAPTTTAASGPAAATGQIATFYAPAAPGGACMTLTVPASRYTAAVGPAEYRGSAACGSYLQVTGARGTILVKVDNLCPECPAGHIDLSDEAFAAIDAPAKGRVPVTYRTVQDPPVSGGIVVRVKEGSSRWWLALQIDNTGNALRTVEVSNNGGPWRSTKRSDNAFWVLDSDPGTGPFQVRITDVAGHVAALPSVTLNPGPLQRFDVRLY